MNSCEDGRCEPLSEQREHRPCPVCSQSVPSDILDEHCQSRFEESAPQTPIAIEDEDEDIICPLGCGQTIPTSDYASHEAAHRCHCHSLLASTYASCTGPSISFPPIVDYLLGSAMKG